MVNRTCKASFNSIPSLCYLNYKVHPSPTDDKTELSLTDNTSVLAKLTVYAQTTHQTKNTVQEIKSSSQNQHQPKTKEPTSSKYSKSYNKAYLNPHNKMHYVKKNASQQTNTKIVLQSPSEPQKVLHSSQFHEEITPTNFPTLPSQTIVSENLLRAQQTQTKDPFQDRLQQNEEKRDKMIEILKSLRNF
jgi:hypothetical protein